MRLPSQRSLRVVVATILLGGVYVGSYILLSTFGCYQVTRSGRVRYDFGLAMADIEIWQPRYTRWQRFRDVNGRDTSQGNELGYMFSPLIQADRRWFHPTRQLFEP